MILVRKMDQCPFLDVYSAGDQFESGVKLVEVAFSMLLRFRFSNHRSFRTEQELSRKESPPETFRSVLNAVIGALKLEGERARV
jgi:hypothetical protein